MPEALDNPAGRLASFLRGLPERGKDCSVGKVLGVTADETEPFAIALRTIEIKRLAAQTRSAVTELPEDEDPGFLLQHFAEVETFVLSLATMAFTSTPIKPGDSFNTRFGYRRPSAGAMYSLDGCAKALHRCRPEPYVRPEQLADLIGHTRALIDEIIATDVLGPPAKTFLVQRLREIETALLGSQITGYADLEAAVDRLTGGLLRRTDTHEEGVLTRINNFIRQLVQTAQGTSAIAGATSSTVQAIESIAHQVTS